MGDDGEEDEEDDDYYGDTDGNKMQIKQEKFKQGDADGDHRMAG